MTLPVLLKKSFFLNRFAKIQERACQYALSLGLALLFSAAAAADPVLNGYAALNDGNYQKAISIWTEAANQGNHDAMGALRSLYEEGSEGWDDIPEFPPNLALGQYWRDREAGMMPAIKEAEAKYFRGRDAYISGNYAAAFRDFSASANAGNNYAKEALGHMYQLGQGVAQSDDLARKWTQIAADEGNIAATTRLGIYYYEGLLYERSFSRALALFRQAADWGNVQAFIQLGYMYANGEGVTQSNTKALNYFLKARESGSEEGAKTYEDFKAHIADYERRAAAVRASNREVDAYNRRVKANNDRIREQRASQAAQFSNYMKSGQNYWANWKPSYCSRFISSSNTTTRGECAN